MGPDRGNMGGVPKLQCSFLQETDKYSGLCEQERYRDGAPMRWLPKGSASCHYPKAPPLPHCVSANGKLLTNHSYSQSTICTHQLFHTVDVAISPACHRPARPLIVLILFDPLGIVCAIQKHEPSTLFLLCKLAVATQNIAKVSYQAWLKISN